MKWISNCAKKCIRMAQKAGIFILSHKHNRTLFTLRMKNMENSVLEKTRIFSSLCSSRTIACLVTPKKRQHGNLIEAASGHSAKWKFRKLNHFAGQLRRLSAKREKKESLSKTQRFCIVCLAGGESPEKKSKRTKFRSFVLFCSSFVRWADVSLVMSPRW